MRHPWGMGHGRREKTENGNLVVGGYPSAHSNMKVQVLAIKNLRLHCKRNAKYKRRYTGGENPFRFEDPGHASETGK